MSIVDLGGLGADIFSGGVQGQMKGGVLSDGTILTSIRTAATTVTIRYSTDGGETWSDCATTITTDSAQGHQHMLVVDEFDYVYVQTVNSTPNPVFSACTFDGSDITVESTYTRSATDRERGEMLVIDNPTRSGDFSNLFHWSGTGGGAFSLDYNRGTDAWDTGTLYTGYTDRIPYSGSPARILLINTAENFLQAAVPSDPEAALVYVADSTTLRGVPMTWDGTNHRWTEETAVDTTVTTLPNGGEVTGAVYDPTVDRFIVVMGNTATNHLVEYGDAPLTAWTSASDLTTASGATKPQTWGMVTSGRGHIEVYALENDDVANIDLVKFVWNDTTPGFNAEIVVSAVESLELSFAFFQIIGWNPAMRYTGYGWMEDNVNQPRIYSVAWQAGGGGFGAIPIGG